MSGTCKEECIVLSAFISADSPREHGKEREEATPCASGVPAGLSYEDPLAKVPVQTKFGEGKHLHCPTSGQCVEGAGRETIAQTGLAQLDALPGTLAGVEIISGKVGAREASPLTSERWHRIKMKCKKTQ